MSSRDSIFRGIGLRAQQTIFEIFLSIALLLFLSMPVLAQKISIGEQIELRYISITQASSTTITSSDDFFTHKARVYLGGQLGDNMKAFFKAQTSGQWGDYTDLWVENAYINFRAFSIPKLNTSADFTIGRQPLLYGDGLLLNDDDTGVNCVKIGIFAPFNTECDIFLVRQLEGPENGDFDIYGIVPRIYLTGHTITGAFIAEDDRSKVAFPEANSLKMIGDLRWEGNIGGVDFHGEAAKQFGNVSEGKTATLTYNALAYLVGAEMKGKMSTIGDVKFGVDWLVADGNRGDDGRTFASTLSHLDEEDWGEYFMVNPSTGFQSCKPGNLVILKWTLSTRFAKRWVVGLNLFNYREEEIRQNELGNEWDIFGKYDMSPYSTLRLAFTLFHPQEAFQADWTTARKILFEMSTEF